MSSSMTSFRVVFLVIVTVCCFADALTLIDERNGGELDVLYLGSDKKLSNSPVRPFDSQYRQRARSAEDAEGWKNPCHFNPPTPRPNSRQSSSRNDVDGQLRITVQGLIRKTESLSKMSVALRQRYATERFGESRESLDGIVPAMAGLEKIPTFNDDSIFQAPYKANLTVVRRAVFELFRGAFLFMAKLSVVLQAAQWEERTQEFGINYQADYLALANQHEYGFYYILCKLEISLRELESTEYPSEWCMPTSVSLSSADLHMDTNAARHYRDYKFLIALSNFLDKMHGHLVRLKQQFFDAQREQRSLNY